MHTLSVWTGMTSLARLVAEGSAQMRLWRARSRQRRELAHLDDWLLRDIGLTRWDVAEETRKAPWQP